MADEISQMLAARGYHLMLSPTRDDVAAESDTIREMIGQNVSGLILVPCGTRTGSRSCRRRTCRQ